MKRVILLLFVLCLVCGCTKEKDNYKEEIKEIDCKEEEQLLADGAILIDVRSSGEFEESHLDGAINIEYGIIEEEIMSVTTDKKAKIIVYCQSGKRSSIAAEALVTMGYSNVYDLGSIDNCSV